MSRDKQVIKKYDGLLTTITNMLETLTETKPSGENLAEFLKKKQTAFSDKWEAIKKVLN